MPDNASSSNHLFSASLEGLSGLRQLTTLHARDNQVALLEGLTPSMAALQYLNLRFGILYSP